MRLALALLTVLCAQGAVVEGVVVDEETGNPLARAQVSLTPLPSAARDLATGATVRTTERGVFTIANARPGWYILRTSRRGFADTEAGQLRAGRPGTPFEVTSDSRSTFFQIRMRRLAAIGGSVLDENNVGIPDWPVHVYTARKPVRHVAEGVTDDRGNFRIGLLDAGAYVVRSGAGLLEDETPLLPTFYKYGTALETAEITRARIGETRQDVTLRPAKGRLFELGGILNSSRVPARLTLITDTGRKVVASSSGNPVPFLASGVPAGPVELQVEGAGCGSSNRIIVDRDITSLRIACTPLSRPEIDWSPNVRYPVLIRRVDPDATGPARTLRPEETLIPGHWEMKIQTGPEHYTKSIEDHSTGNDGWFGLEIGGQARLQVTLSSRPASLSGTIFASGKPVTGAPVFLEMFDPDLPDARIQLWEGRADAQGHYTFTGLPPGTYRALSGFDFDTSVESGPEHRLAMENAPVLTLREGNRATQDLAMALP